MPTAAEIEAWRDALIRARLAGTRALRYEGREIEYKSDAEMQAAIAAADKLLADASGTARLTDIRISSSKGL